MKRRETLINLFQYIDYRRYLKDWYQATKISRAALSFRNFSKRAGFSSPNFLKLVMEGKRNLTEESLSKCMVGLNLNKQEQDFFRSLVFFNQAQDEEQKNAYYQRLLQSRKFNQIKPLEKEQYEYCSHWSHAVIRELITAKEFDGTPEWLAKRINPSVTVAQVQKSLELLERLGFIKKEGDRWKQSHSLVTTGAEAASLALFQYHDSLLEVTKEVLKTIPSDKRDISALTLGVSKKTAPLLKNKIQEFRKEILKLVSTDLSAEEVIQLNIQMFPFTKENEVKNK